MENASKALLMAGSVLIGLLILSLMLTLFINIRDVSTEYDSTKKSEAIQQFNTNFIKYLGQDLTMHNVITITNFANVDDNKVANVGVTQDNSSYTINTSQITKDMNDASQYYKEEHNGENVKIEVVYTMQILEYNNLGYVSKIKFKDRRFRITYYDSNGKIIDIETDNI